MVSEDHGKYQVAETRFRDALTHFEAAGDQANIALTTTHLGVVAWGQRDLARAVPTAKRGQRCSVQRRIHGALPSRLATWAWFRRMRTIIIARRWPCSKASGCGGTMESRRMWARHVVIWERWRSCRSSGTVRPPVRCVRDPGGARAGDALSSRALIFERGEARAALCLAKQAGPPRIPKAARCPSRRRMPKQSRSPPKSPKSHRDVSPAPVACPGRSTQIDGRLWSGLVHEATEIGRLTP